MQNPLKIRFLALTQPTPDVLPILRSVAQLVCGREVCQTRRCTQTRLWLQFLNKTWIVMTAAVYKKKKKNKKKKHVVTTLRFILFLIV